MCSEISTATQGPADSFLDSIEISPLTCGIGAEVLGFDFSTTVSDTQKEFLNQALFEHQVLLFRDQKLDEEQFVRFSQLFGECRVMWQNKRYPSRNKFTHYLSNVDLDGNSIGQHPDINSTYWHSDGSWSNPPARATVLNAIEVPEGYGSTYFANMYQVFNKLDQSHKNRLWKYSAEHNFELARVSRDGRLPWQWWSTR